MPLMVTPPLAVSIISGAHTLDCHIWGMIVDVLASYFMCIYVCSVSWCFSPTISTSSTTSFTNPYLYQHHPSPTTSIPPQLPPPPPLPPTTTHSTPPTTLQADTHVFPGGKLDEADHSHQWAELYSTLARQSISDMMGSFTSNCRERLPIYKSVSSDGIPGEVSLRINAIRETFEESGILMLRDAGKMAEVHGGRTAGSVKPALRILEKELVKKWRERVHDNAYDFITMCRSGGSPWRHTIFGFAK